MKRKYILKPGRHQFAPGSPAVHTNENTSDEEAEWYLEKYPHIGSLFESAKTENLEDVEDRPSEKAESVKLKNIGEITTQSVKSLSIIGEITTQSVKSK